MGIQNVNQDRENLKKETKSFLNIFFTWMS